MCGIVGVINHKQSGLSADDRNVFKRLLYIDVERGPDSTGIFSVSNGGKVDLLKSAEPSYDFLKHKEVDELIGRAYSNGTFIVGHNRKATQGSIKDENAHPFAEGNVVLVHNGSLWNHRSVEDVDVDSRAIAMALNKANNNVTEVFNKLKGAYACVWYDNLTQSLNFFRNKERPLFFYEINGTTFFASEWLMLYYATMKEGIKWDSDKCIPLEVHQHLRFTKNKYGGASPKNAPIDIVIEENTNFQQAHPAGTTKTDGQKDGKDTQDATTKISLNQRKKFRDQFHAFLQKSRKQQFVTFIPADYADAGGDKKWLIFGDIADSPEHVIGCASVEGLTEEQVMELCGMEETLQLESKILSHHADHKRLVFQINVQIDPEYIKAFQATPTENRMH